MGETVIEMEPLTGQDSPSSSSEELLAAIKRCEGRWDREGLRAIQNICRNGTKGMVTKEILDQANEDKFKDGYVRFIQTLCL